MLVVRDKSGIYCVTVYIVYSNKYTNIRADYTTQSHQLTLGALRTTTSEEQVELLKLSGRSCYCFAIKCYGKVAE